MTVGDDSAGPCLPWLYGDHIKPIGSYCKVCWNSFKFGGFLDEHQTLTKFRKEIKAKPILLDEFRAARGVYLKLLNCGQLKMRVRGAAADALSTEIQDHMLPALGVSFSSFFSNTTTLSQPIQSSMLSYCCG